MIVNVYVTKVAIYDCATEFKIDDIENIEDIRQACITLVLAHLDDHLVIDGCTPMVMMEIINACIYFNVALSFDYKGERVRMFTGM